MDLILHLSSFQLALRAGTAASASLAVAQFLGLQYPLFSAIAAVIVTDLSPRQSRKLGVVRIGATLLGAWCGVGFALLFSPSALIGGVAVAAAMVICAISGLKDGARLAGYIAAIIAFEHSGSPWGYAYFRLIETMLGVAIAWTVSFVPKIIRGEKDADGGG
jgi:uncharacterized membrane protein YgaE (UPF0421/DUF939 family)